MGHPVTRSAVQRARPRDIVQLTLQPCDTIAKLAPVGFYLCLARAAEKAESATLALQMSPRPNQAAALVRKRRQLDL